MAVVKYTEVSIAKADNNEDACYIDEHIAFVLDGATGLFKERITPEPSDARWFAQQWKKYLQANLPDWSRSLSKIIHQGILDIDKQYMCLPGAADIKSKPSSGVACCRVRDGKMQFFILGDCAILIIKDDTYLHLAIDDLAFLDSGNIRKAMEIAKQRNISVRDARPFIADGLAAVRFMQNKPGGYWILAGDPDAAYRGYFGQIDIKDARSILLMTDGFTQIFDTLFIHTKPELCQLIRDGVSLETLAKQIRDAQTLDAGCNKHPRLKTHDDTTAVMWRLIS